MSYSHQLLLFLTLLCTCVRAQTVDTLPVYEGGLTTVTAYGEGVKLAPAVRVGSAQLDRYDESSLLSGLNRVPGVRFEERATASYRIAIRGSSLRAPFGVRNTQVYWNGIPFGEPGGDVPLNFLDAVNIDEVEVLKGPAGGFYGPGTSGTLLLNNSNLTHPHSPKQKFNVDAGITAGSYGYARADVKVQRNKAFGTYNQLRLGYQQTDGYRDHSGMQRFTAQYSSTLRSRKFGPLTKLHALYTKLDYELPGGLTAEQFAENPRQARPGSAEKNASIHYHNLLLGLTDERYYGNWKMESSLYATGFYFDHPFNFDYKRETNLGAGGRVAVSRVITKSLAFDLGGELRLQNRAGQNFTNPEGLGPGDLNFSDEIFSRERLLFSQLKFSPGKRVWNFTLGLSNSGLNYTVDRTFDSNGNTGVSTYSTNRPLSLRLAAGRNFGSGHRLYVSRTDGFSPPTLDEFRTNEGSLNLNLNPEVGTNYELGYALNKSCLQLSANVFVFVLDEAITSFTDARGTQLFQNAGKTRQNGLELSASYQLTSTADKAIGVRLYGSYTYFDFEYKDFAQRGNDFSGNSIPGAAPHTANLEVGLSHKNGLSLDLFHNFTDRIPLNDANDVFAEDFNLLRVRVAYRFKGYEIFITGSNLLDERMSFGNDLNPRFGNRYFQPAPGRNWQFGVRRCW